MQMLFIDSLDWLFETLNAYEIPKKHSPENTLAPPSWPFHYFQGMNEINDIWNLDLKHFTNEDAICEIIGVIIVNSKHI
jgi:hypothetical protein